MFPSRRTSPRRPPVDRRKRCLARRGEPPEERKFSSSQSELGIGPVNAGRDPWACARAPRTSRKFPPLPQGRRYPGGPSRERRIRVGAASATPQSRPPDDVTSCATPRRIRHNEPSPSHLSKSVAPAAPDQPGATPTTTETDSRILSRKIPPVTCTSPPHQGQGGTRRHLSSEGTGTENPSPPRRGVKTPRSALLGGETVREEHAGKASLAGTPPDEWRRSIHEDPV